MAIRFRIYDELGRDEVELDYIGDFSLDSYQSDTPVVRYELLAIVTGTPARRSNVMLRLRNLLRNAPDALMKDFGYVWLQFDNGVGVPSGRTLVRQGSLIHTDGMDYNRSSSFITLSLDCNAGFETEERRVELGTVSMAGGAVAYPAVDDTEFVRALKLDFAHSAVSGSVVKSYIGFRDYNFGTSNFVSSVDFVDFSYLTAVVDTETLAGSYARADLSDIYIYTTNPAYTKYSLGEFYYYDIFSSIEELKHQYGNYNLILRYKMNSNTIIKLVVTSDSLAQDVLASCYLQNTGTVYQQCVLSTMSIPTHNKVSDTQLGENIFFWAYFVAGDHTAGTYLQLDQIIFMPENFIEVSGKAFNNGILRIEQFPHKTIANNVGGAGLDYRYLSNLSLSGNVKLCVNGGLIVIYSMRDTGVAPVGSVDISGDLIYGNSGY